MNESEVDERSRNENTTQVSVLSEIYDSALSGRGIAPHLRIVNNRGDDEIGVCVDKLSHLGLHVLLTQVSTAGLKQEQKLDFVSGTHNELSELN